MPQPERQRHPYCVSPGWPGHVCYPHDVYGVPTAAPCGAIAPPSTAPGPIAAAEYDPATGTYTGPDGHTYTQSDLARDSGKVRTWQQMLTPGGNQPWLRPGVSADRYDDV